MIASPRCKTEFHETRAPIVTADDSPLVNFASKKQQRLLTEPQYASCTGSPGGRRFLATANVGLLPAIHRPPLVPDVHVSLDGEAPEGGWTKRHRLHLVWEFCKAPEVEGNLVATASNAPSPSDIAPMPDRAMNRAATPRRRPLSA